MISRSRGAWETTDVEFLRGAAQGVVELRDEVPANLVLTDVTAGVGLLLRGRLIGLALLEINITVCSHDCWYGVYAGSVMEKRKPLKKGTWGGRTRYAAGAPIRTRIKGEYGREVADSANPGKRRRSVG